MQIKLLEVTKMEKAHNERMHGNVSNF